MTTLAANIELVRGLSFNKLDNLILYDIFYDLRDYIRILSKFNLNDKSSKFNCIFLCSSNDKQIIEILKIELGLYELNR